MIVIWGRFCSPEGVINSSCGSYESSLAWDSPFWAVGGGGERGGEVLWAVSKVEGSAHVPRLLKFILLEGFSGTLLVVSILGMFYDRHLRPLLQS